MAWGDLIVEREEAPAPCKLHAVMLPFPAYSHVFQFLHFARQLVREHRFTVTILNSTYHHKELMKSHAAENGVETGLNDGIEFSHVSDGLPDGHPRLAGNLMQYVMAVYAMEPAVNTALADVHDKTPITCLVRDLHLPFAFKSVRDASIAVAAFAPSSAMKEHLNRNMRALIDEGLLPDVDKEESNFIDWKRPITGVEGVPPQLRVEDLPIWPSVRGKLHGAVVHSIEKRTRQYVNSDWVIVNTVYELERETINAMRKQTPNICTPGPLSLAAHHGEPTCCIDWLNGQEPRSVILLAFGTTTVRSVDQFKEVASGLEASQHRFLWVLGAEQVATDSEVERERFLSFMADFAERTKHRGFITKWISRFLATLRHPAVGAFLSHCGWHSVLEGLSSGVPFLTWPFQYDHYPVARCVTHVWQVGLSLHRDSDSALVSRDEVERKVRRMLAPPGHDVAVDAIRVRSARLMLITQAAIAPGGSSQRSLASFVGAMRKPM